MSTAKSGFFVVETESMADEWVAFPMPSVARSAIRAAAIVVAPPRMVITITSIIMSAVHCRAKTASAGMPVREIQSSHEPAYPCVSTWRVQLGSFLMCGHHCFPSLLTLGLALISGKGTISITVCRKAHGLGLLHWCGT
jgi:hypothetical protein